MVSVSDPVGPSAQKPIAAHVIVVMDADCALCSALARLIASRDEADIFRILPSSTERGRGLLTEHGLDAADPESWLALKPDGAALLRSDAALFVGRALAGPIAWIAYFAMAVPRPLRDWIYRRVARNRYRWFGRGDLCASPSPELRRKLLK